MTQNHGHRTTAALTWREEGGCSAHTGMVRVRLERMASKRWLWAVRDAGVKNGIKNEGVGPGSKW